QPSEFVKIAMIMLAAAWEGKVSRRVDRFWEGAFAPAVALGIVVVLLIKQPDIGSSFMVCLAVLSVMCVAGVKLWHLAVIGGGGALVLGARIASSETSMNRIRAIFNPEAVSADAIRQIEHAKAAFVSAGWKGLGYGNSLRKERFLAEAHTDFILAMVGEELGLIATILVVVAYSCILVAGFMVALRATDRFGKLLAFGLTFYLCFAAGFNIAVATAFAPTKGIALPFLSYGGSSMLASMIAIGLLLSVARVTEKEQGNAPPVQELDV
ncbi:MAG: FtsW/RodA/SpoVE family cell cycle protein, partial [Kiritimatiellaeota bacterium]|nr:FtsW/RodA/SpoVE family cell cycle protein [Kiritimatiellota bacterium]